MQEEAAQEKNHRRKKIWKSKKNYKKNYK